jgi:signal transduction histidine kinase
MASTSTIDRFARVALASLAFLCLVVVTGPALSFRDDVAAARQAADDRLQTETRVLADAMDIAIRLRLDELVRLARRPEVDLADENTAPERAMLSLTHGDSSLFRRIAFVDVKGRPVWSEPPGRVDAVDDEPWFRDVLRSGQGVDLATSAGDTVAFGVTVNDGARVMGALIGYADASEQLSPLRLFSADVVVLRSTRGDVALVSSPPEHDKDVAIQMARDAVVPATHTRVEVALERSGLSVVVVRRAEPLRAGPLRQLVVVALLQLACVVVLAMTLRRSYGALRQAEARLAEHETLVQLGNASALIAHEVKNALNGLNAAASYIGATPGLGDAARLIKGQVDRLSSLARALLDFARPSSPAQVPFDLAAVARDAVDGCRGMASELDVVIETHGSEALPVAGDPLLALTAIDNLIRNGVEAIDAARASGRTVPVNVTVGVGVRGGGAVVTIEDHAGGPDPDVEATMFTAFRTTKPKGIGLGLVMARRAIEVQGGTLSFTRIDGGSRFTVVLPLLTHYHPSHEPADPARR